MKEYFMTTKRTGFSTWSETDINDAIELWGDTQVSKYLTANGVLTREQIYERLKHEIENYEKYNLQYWPVYLLEIGDNIGCCGLKPYEDKILEIGSHLKPKYWKSGYGRELSLAVIKYAFQDLGAEGIFGRHHPHNMASEKLLKKLGFKHIRSEFCNTTGLYHPFYLLDKEGYMKKEECIATQSIR